RQRERHGAAELRTRAVDPDLATHEVDHPLAQAKTQTDAAVAPRVGAIGLQEHLEGVAQELLRHADARVGDLELDHLALGHVLDTYGDLARVSELDRVVEQMTEDLARAPGISDRRWQLRRSLAHEAQPLRRRARLLLGEHLVQDAEHIDPFAL